jgi:integrase
VVISQTAAILNRPLEVSRNTMTLKDALDRLVVESPTPGRRASKGALARKIVSGPGSGRFGLPPSLPLAQLTTALVIQLRVARQQEGVAPGTIGNELSVLRELYRAARNQWGVTTAAGVLFELPRVEHRTRYFSRAEEATLLDALDPWRKDACGRRPGRQCVHDRVDQRDMVVILADTGCRYGEVAALLWDCVDTVEWLSINIYRSKVGNEGVLCITTRLRAVLKRRYAARGNQPYIFTTTAGEPAANISKPVRQAITRAGLNAPHLVKRHGPATVRTLRHTFASRLVQGGMSLYQVQKLLGHSSPTHTQRYAHLVPDDAAKAAVALLDEAPPVKVPLHPKKGPLDAMQTRHTGGCHERG